jgi:hypothetical protein
VRDASVPLIPGQGAQLANIGRLEHLRVMHNSTDIEESKSARPA